MSIEDEIKAAMDAEIGETKAELETTAEVAVKEDKYTDTPDGESKEYTEFEKEQMSKGWNPDGVKSAEEYARTEPLYDELKNRGKQIKQMQKTLDEVKDHIKKQEQVAFDKALAHLRQERLEAIARGDIQAVMDIEKHQHNMQQVTETSAVIPEADAFTEKYEHIFKSSDYEEMEIAEFVKNRDVELMNRHMSPKEHMATLEQHMLKKFPSYFGQKEVVNRSETSVESGTGSNVAKKASKTRYTLHDLSPEQKQVARDFEKFGIMKIDEYIKQLAEAKEIK